MWAFWRGQGWRCEGGAPWVSHAYEGEIAKGSHWQYVDVHARSLCGEVVARQAYEAHRAPHPDAPACFKCMRLT